MELDDLFNLLGDNKSSEPKPPPAEEQEEKGREEVVADTPTVEGDKSNGTLDFDDIVSVVPPTNGTEELTVLELPSEEEVIEEELHEVVQLPATEPKKGLSLCRHECKCGKAWSHMLHIDECKARSIDAETVCPDCVVNDTHSKVPNQDILSWEVQINNSEIARCHLMDQGQLIEHIKHLQKEINELRIRQQRSRALLADRMEKDFTDEERADFKKTLKNVEKREKQTQKREKVAGNQKERAIKSLMNALGISYEKAQKMVEGD